MAVVSAREANELKRLGMYRADRHVVDVGWGDVANRPSRKKQRAGKKWARSEADERALADGCWFDERQAEYVCEWFRQNLQHCIGEWCGQPFELLDWQREEIVYPLFGWQRVDDRGRIVRRHKRTFIEIPKKNGKSTMASGIGLYMLVGEGVNGAEVYSYASDKDQAGIVHNNAIRMVEASERLSYFLKVNYTTKHIYNHKHSLCYRAESSRPSGSQGKIGNCAIIDELHAWYGQELWDSLRYLGVNWPEPLHFVITTAGDDTEHLCYKLYEYALAVERGEIVDHELMVCIKEAKPDDDIRDPEVQKKANPSLGFTIGAEDLRKHIDQAEAVPRELMSLKRYRFNIWATKTAPWLAMHDWGQCLGGEVEGLKLCYGGLDLARKSDMSALSLIWPEGDEAHVRCWFWLPEETAERWSHLASYQQWAKQGWLTLTEGGVADFSRIEEEIVSIFKKYKPKSFAFDEKYAEEITQRIERQSRVQRIAFGQTMRNFAGPAARLEKMVVGHQLRHDGNPILGWQAGNVTVKEDMDGNIRPVRYSKDDHRSIDGVVSTIMALGLIQAFSSSIYATRGMVTV